MTLLGFDTMENPIEQLDFCACPMCSSTQRTPARYTFGPHGVVRCLSCGLWYLFPRLKEAHMLSAYQEESYYDVRHDSGYNDYRSQEQALRTTFRALLKRLAQRGMLGGNLLEIGCAYGFLLDEARDDFSRRCGVEMAGEAIEQASQIADRVFEGDLLSVTEDDFDLAMAIQVIEHIYDPVTFVQQAVEKLKPGGRLLLATPHMGSFWRPLFRRRWPSFKIPEHVTYFDQHTLSDLMRRGGLEEIESVPYPHAFPLALVASKLNLRVPRPLQGLNFWLPATTLALVGKRPR